MVIEDDQHIEEAETDRRHHEQIHRSDTGGVVAQKGLPALVRRLVSSRHVLGYRRLGDLDTKLEQLAMNARRAPQWIGTAHLADEAAQLARAVPSHHRLGLDDHNGVQHGRAQPIKPNEDQPIDERQPRPRWHPAAQDVQLVPENHDLGFKSPVGPEQRAHEPRQELQTIDHPVSQ